MVQTRAELVRPARRRRILTNEVLSVASAALVAVALIAIARGRPHWGEATAILWIHLSTILVAVALTPVMLLRAKGNRSHRRLGYVWVTAMLVTAGTSLFFNARTGGRHSLGVFSGDFSPIHLLSFWVLFQVPLLVARARAHDIARHERGVRGIVVGGLVIAGFFTFPFGRMLGRWLLA